MALLDPPEAEYREDIIITPRSDFVALLMGYGYWATATYAVFIALCSYEAFLHAWSCLRELVGENRMEAVLREISARWESRGLCWVQVKRSILLEKDGLQAVVEKTEVTPFSHRLGTTYTVANQAQYRIRSISSQ